MSPTGHNPTSSALFVAHYDVEGPSQQKINEGLLTDREASHVRAFGAVLAAIIGGLAGHFTARHTAAQTTATEITKLGVGVRQKVLEQLVQVRLKKYPALYKVLSDFRKATEEELVNLAAVAELRSEVNKWDSANAVVLGRQAIHDCYAFRLELKKFANLIEAQPDKAKSPERDLLVTKAVRLEAALRSDLGIYGIVNLEKDMDTQPNVTYEEPTSPAPVALDTRPS